jgi:hypothetical protein
MKVVNEPPLAVRAKTLWITWCRSRQAPRLSRILRLRSGHPLTAVTCRPGHPSPVRREMVVFQDPFGSLHDRV